MNDILTTISFSIFSNKGVYALLLGSGVSKSAGIPTGWDIVIDLINQLAAMKGEDCSANPEKWFSDKYGEEPDYPRILSKLARTPDERMNLLKHYFEATEDEKKQGLKQPTKAHRCIAKLIKKGYIKVVVTTNFDRLLEKALSDEGVEPIVIRHTDDIEGTLPLVHTKFVIIKINGDYLDSRCLNTKDELSNYKKALNDYILRIINEFGIISCGWSGKWDSGLIRIIKRCQNFRFSNYWTYVGQCEDELKEIAQRRKGAVVKIESSDVFFREICHNIDALETFNQNNPLTTDIAVARLKKYIVKDEYRIYLYDLIQDQLKEVIDKIKIDNNGKPLKSDKSIVMSKLTHTVHSMETLLLLIINGVYWAREEQYELFVDVLKSISMPEQYGDLRFCFNHIYANSLIYFPSLLILYAIGLSALKRDNYAIINQCFNLKIIGLDFSEGVLIKDVNSSMVSKPKMKEILEQKGYNTLSTYLHNILEPIFVKYFYSGKEFQNKFNLFEYLISLNYVHLVEPENEMNWAPCGEYHSRYYGRHWKPVLKNFLEEAAKEQDQWKPLRSGMFEGKYEVFEDVRSKLEGVLNKIPIR